MKVYRYSLWHKWRRVKTTLTFTVWSNAKFTLVSHQTTLKFEELMLQYDLFSNVSCLLSGVLFSSPFCVCHLRLSQPFVSLEIPCPTEIRGLLLIKQNMISVNAEINSLIPHPVFKICVLVHEI